MLRTGELILLDSIKRDQMERDGHFVVLGTKPREFYAVPLKRLNVEVFGGFAVQTYDDDLALEPQYGEILQELAPASRLPSSLTVRIASENAATPY